MPTWSSRPNISGSGTPVSRLRFLDAAEATFGRLAVTPGIGEPVETRDPLVRGLRCSSISGFPNHLIFYYRSSDDEMVVVRVLHGARDLGRIFED